MVEGELIQLDRIGRLDITEADCMELADRKTACLFSACAKLGAVSAGADTAAEEKLGEFAWNLGMAFQLIDDMLDFTSREQTLGKPVGGDLKEGKVTLPLVYALENANAAERHQVEIVLNERTYDSAPFAEIYSMIERRGGIQRTRQQLCPAVHRSCKATGRGISGQSLSARAMHADRPGHRAGPLSESWRYSASDCPGSSTQSV